MGGNNEKRFIIILQRRRKLYSTGHRCISTSIDRRGEGISIPSRSERSISPSFEAKFDSFPYFVEGFGETVYL